MSTFWSRVVFAVAGAGLVSTAVFGSLYTLDREERTWAGMAPPAQDALTQSLDLNRIADFHYVNDSTVEVIDEQGHQFAMKFTTPCPEFRTARDFSLVTESF